VHFSGGFLSTDVSICISRCCQRPRSTIAHLPSQLFDFAVISRDANARMTADLSRAAECSRADGASWLKVRSNPHCLTSRILDAMQGTVTYSFYSLLSLSVSISLSTSLSLSASPPPLSLILSLLLLSLSVSHPISLILSLFDIFGILSFSIQERESIIDAAGARIRALEDDREGNC
jgi:hypothetical protein